MTYIVQVAVSHAVAQEWRLQEELQNRLALGLWHLSAAAVQLKLPFQAQGFRWCHRTTHVLRSHRHRSVAGIGPRVPHLWLWSDGDCFPGPPGPVLHLALLKLQLNLQLSMPLQLSLLSLSLALRLSSLSLSIRLLSSLSKVLVLFRDVTVLRRQPLQLGKSTKKNSQPSCCRDSSNLILERL